MSNLPFEVYVRHRGYRLPFPLHRWHLPEEREDTYPPENFRPSEFDPVNLILRRVDPSGPITLSIEGTPYRIALEEGADYNELIAWAAPKDEDAEDREGLWGRAGLYRLRVTHGTDAWVTTIEVLPHYLTFEQMGRMCADIERLSTWVAYDVLPYAPVVGSRVPRLARGNDGEEDPAVMFALLKETVPEALRSLRYLSSSPHLTLRPTYVATRSGVTARQDRRSMRMEERLNEREEGWAVQRTGVLSYDIYENRFVKRLLQELQRRLSQLQALLMDALDELERQEDEVRRRLRRQFGDQQERILREEPLWTRPIRNRRSGLRSQIVQCGRMKDALAAVMRTDLLRDIPPLQGIVRPTNVLQHDPQYSRLWSVYRLLRLSDRGETSLAHRFHRHSRPSWELYEMWAAVQVMETCMRDLRFTRVIAQSVAEGDGEGVVYLYDTPRPAVIKLAHETEPITAEIIYGGFVPMSEQALMAHMPAPAPSGWDEAEIDVEENIAGAGDKLDELVFGGATDTTDLSSEDQQSVRSPDEDSSEESSLTEAANSGEIIEDRRIEPDLDDGNEGEYKVEGETDEPEEAPLSPPTYEERHLVTRGVQTSPDLQIRFFDAETEELLGVLILDAKYKGGRRIWGREGGKLTNDRLALESYLMDIHRRGREEAAFALFSEPADDIVMGAYALYPGERYGQDLSPGERFSADGRLGAVKMNPEGLASEELTQLLIESFAQAQVRRNRLLGWDAARTGENMAEEGEATEASEFPENNEAPEGSQSPGD